MSSCDPVIDAGQQLEELQRVLDQSEAFLADLELRHARCDAVTGAGDNFVRDPAENEGEEAPEPPPNQKKGIRGLSSLKSKLTKWFSSRRVARTKSLPAETPERRLSFSRVNLEFPGEAAPATAPAAADDSVCDDVSVSAASILRQRAMSLRPLSLGRGVSFSTSARPKSFILLATANRSVGSCGSGPSSGLCSPSAMSPMSLQLSRAQVPDAAFMAATDAALPRRASVTNPDSAFQRPRAVQGLSVGSSLHQHPSQRRLMTDSIGTSPQGRDSGSPLGSPSRAASMRRRTSAEVVPSGEQFLGGGGGGVTGGVYGLPTAWGVYDRVVMGSSGCGGSSAKYTALPPLAGAASRMQQFEFSPVGDSQRRADAAATASVRPKSLPAAAHRALAAAGGLWYSTTHGYSSEDASTHGGALSSGSWAAETSIPGALPECAYSAVMVDGGGGSSTASTCRQRGQTMTGGTSEDSRWLSQMQGLPPPQSLSQVQVQPCPNPGPPGLRQHRPRSMQQSFVSPEPASSRSASKLSRRSSLERPQPAKALPGIPEPPPAVGLMPDNLDIAQVRTDARRQTWNNEVCVPVI